MACLYILPGFLYFFGKQFYLYCQIRIYTLSNHYHQSSTSLSSSSSLYSFHLHSQLFHLLGMVLFLAMIPKASFWSDYFVDWSATVGMFGAHLHDSDTVLLGIAANIDTPSQSFGNSVAESSFLGLSFYFFAMNQRVQILTSTVSIVSHLSSYCRGSFS